MRASFGLVVLLSACSSSSALPRIDGAPSPATAVTVHTVLEGTDVSAIGVGDGAFVAGVGDHLVRSKLLGDDAISNVALRSTAGEPTTVGTTSLITARGLDGWLAVSDHGLFAGAGDGVAVSPFTTFVGQHHVRALDVAGDAANETLWIVADDGAWVRRGTQVVPIAVGGSKIDAIAAIDDHRALVLSAGALSEIDVASGVANTVLDEAPAIAESSRGADGSLWLATDRGLVVRSPSGELTVRTFVASSDAPRAVRSVAAGIDRVVALVGPDVVTIVDGAAQVLVSDRAAASRVAVDGNGDVWVSSPKKIERVALGKPSSFAVDVAPFMKKHCQSCHAGGAGGAPVRAFDDYDTARAAASEISVRLRAAGRPVMPPPQTERLAPADVRVVLRWIAGGMPR